MSKTVIIRNVEFHFAHVVKSHAPFGTEIWDVQLRTEDEGTAKELMDVGVNMKKHADGYFHANVKRPVESRKGEAMKAPVVVDKNKQPVEGMIGHGSKGHVKLFSYDYNVQGRSGTAAMLVAMQITDLVEYKGGDSVDFDVEDASDF